MKNKTLLKVLLLAVMATALNQQINAQKKGGQIFISSPVIFFNKVHPSLGHVLRVQNKIPLNPGVGFWLRSPKKLGLQASLYYLPTSYDVDYNFNSTPDPSIPSWSEFRNNYLAGQLLLDLAIVEKEKYEISLLAGADGFLLVHYSDVTLFTNSDTRTNSLKDSFRRAFLSFDLGISGKAFFKDKFFLNVQPVLRYFPTPLESQDFISTKHFTLGAQLGVGMYKH
ncbi:MAG: hypothetical protein H6581_02010 [Bacteroidia bacterium]|nr:hypothetical protein [Bacteroidia bacterium]